MLTDEMISEAGLDDFPIDAVIEYWDHYRTFDGFLDDFQGIWGGDTAAEAVGMWIWSRVRPETKALIPREVKPYIDIELMGTDRLLTDEVWAVYLAGDEWAVFLDR